METETFKEKGKSFFTKEKLKKLAKPTKKKVIILAILLVVIIIGVVSFGRKKSVMKNVITSAEVTKGDVIVTITGSAAVEPYERFEIIPKVSGDIVYCPYEVGDAILEDDILYMFDTSDIDLTVERQNISMQQSQNSYNDALEEKDKLYIKAKNNGIISGLTIKVGQEVNMGVKVATIEDNKNLEVEVPFTGAQADMISVGDSAVITSSKHMSTVTGTVTHKSSDAYAGTDGTYLYNVIIEFKNPGAFYDGMTVGASVNGQISPGKGTVSALATGTISTETDGTVTAVNYKNGDYVTKGTVIATLKSDTITDRINDSTLSYKSADIAMRQTEKTLEDYNIKSPINGTVITKNAKTGDTIDRTNSTTTLMVVADISKLKFELAIDELDVNKVKEGQEVSITCDALPDERFSGVITNVSVEGTSANGVTTYSAEVEIDNPGNLRPSMNVDAEIVIDSKTNVLRVPTDTIKSMGKEKYVFVKDDGKKTNEKDTEEAEKKDGKQRGATLQAPDGYVLRKVEVGLSNEDYTEIISGLLEGDIVYREATQGGGLDSMMQNMRGGGMNDGGMGGGPNGGPPSGGMR